ncbi:MAG TPA: helix-turn-helix domain-containing protein, partial [Candidatus Saccharimonadia bacterium]|nr:helix-turn-helix domain-containing protein [Candidatus Saccharimonadia bacterium]
MTKREQEIIAAAAKVFKEKGYHAATTRDIAAEVGIQQATLYYYISSKEELLYLVVREPIVRLYDQVEEIV